MPTKVIRQQSLTHVEEEPRALAPTGGGEIGELLRAAVDGKVDADSMEKLVNLYERMADRKAHSDFNAAFAEFKAECPAIKKTETVAFGAAGKQTRYTFAPLDGICKVVDPILHKYGFAYSWDTLVDNDLIRVACRLDHAAGHSRSSTFACPFTSNAGMSEQQKYASARSYGERMSLTQVLGLSTTDEDNDAVLAQTIGPGQIAELEALIEEVKADRERFLKYCGVANIEAIQVGDYVAHVNALERKR